MSVLNLFPARVRFVNPDGTLTPEAVRMLDVLVTRVGGALGDNGADVFAAAVAGDTTGMLPSVEQPVPSAGALAELLLQPADLVNDGMPTVQQQPDYRPGAGLQLVDYRFSLKDTDVVPGTYGNAANVARFTVDQQGRLTMAEAALIQIARDQVDGLGSIVTENKGANFTGSFTGKTVTVSNGIITQVV
ncbi:MAG: hypothetical protein ACRYF7_23000 [Janthinobacterium lividum]